VSNLNKYRLDLAEDEFKLLREILTNETINPEFKSGDIYKSLIEKSTKPKIIKPSAKRIKNAQINRKKRSTAAEKKIHKAIDTLKKDNKTITAYSIAKQAKVAYNTAKKYIEAYKNNVISITETTSTLYQNNRYENSERTINPTETISMQSMPTTTETSEIAVTNTTPEILKELCENQQEQETVLTIEPPITTAAEMEITTAELAEPKYQQEAKQIKNINDSKTQEQANPTLCQKNERNKQKKMKREERREKKREDKRNGSSENS